MSKESRWKNAPWIVTNDLQTWYRVRKRIRTFCYISPVFQLIWIYQKYPRSSK